jgi:Raf kinase inhibitor-like YbhB/YbcL family protein
MLRTAAIVGGMLVLSGCGGTTKTATTPQPPARSVQVSSDFAAGAAIPRVHACDGRETSPPLRVTGLPARTREIVVSMVDPDAPGGDFTHWLIAHLSSAGGAISLAAGARPTGAVVGRNSFGSLGYRGPCPPTGPAHHYRITVDALGQSSGLTQGFSAEQVSTLAVIGQGTLVGTYARH